MPAIALALFAHRLPRSVDAAAALLLGVLALGAGLIARIDLLLAAAILYLLAGSSRGCGVNRGGGRLRAWTNRALSVVGAVLAAFLVVYPTLIMVDYLAKPRTAIDQTALSLPHKRVSFPASDGVTSGES